MENKTIYITLLDGYCSSYFMDEVSSKALIDPTFLTFHYLKGDYRILTEFSKATVSPMTFKAYKDYKDKFEKEDTFECVIPTFEEIWALLINGIISDSIKQLEKYHHKPSKIIFTISESYKFHGIYDIVTDVISQFKELYPTIEFGYIDYSDIIKESMIKDYYINMGAEKINSDKTKQIHSFFEVGLNSTIIYTMQINFKNEENKNYPSKTKILEKTIIPIGITSPIIELIGDNSNSFEKQSLYFLNRFNENLTKKLPCLNAVSTIYFLNDNDDKIPITKTMLSKTTFGKSILNELKRIKDDWNPLTLKQISDCKLSFLTEKILLTREGNGTHEGGFKATGYVNLIYDGTYRINEYSPNKEFAPLSKFFKVPLVDFNVIRIIPRHFNHFAILEYFNEVNKKYNYYLSIKSRVQSETPELFKQLKAGSEIKKWINEAKKIIDMIAANDGDKYYELWCQFKNELSN